jgi:hypothetical protein
MRNSFFGELFILMAFFAAALLAGLVAMRKYRCALMPLRGLP